MVIGTAVIVILTFVILWDIVIIALRIRRDCMVRREGVRAAAVRDEQLSEKKEKLRQTLPQKIWNETNDNSNDQEENCASSSPQQSQPQQGVEVSSQQLLEEPQEQERIVDVDDLEVATVSNNNQNNNSNSNSNIDAIEKEEVTDFVPHECTTSDVTNNNHDTECIKIVIVDNDDNPQPQQQQQLDDDDDERDEDDGNQTHGKYCNNYYNNNHKECSVCLAEFENGCTICYSNNPSCNHIFHHECMVEWLVKHDECPCCRQQYIIMVEEDDQKEDEQQEQQETP